MPPPRSTRSRCRRSGRPGSSGSIWGRRPASARPAPCSTRVGGATSAGADVVIGFVETHGRPHTAELIRDLPAVPRRVVEYRGTTFEEMDLAAVLDRHPEVVLIDELAHTNVPGSGPHEKRWQDVLDLLDAGIAVISTVNIQHLESLADAVEAITGVPDPRAGARLGGAQGGPGRAHRLLGRPAAAAHAPRQHLPGRQGARRPDRLLQDREPGGPARAGVAVRGRRDRGGAAPLPARTSTRARCGTPPSGSWWRSPAAPGSDGVVRRAARMARRAKGDLLVLHVRRVDGSAVPGSSAERPWRPCGTLVEDVGGAWLRGDRATTRPGRWCEFADEHQVTQIVVGATRRSRWEEMRTGARWCARSCASPPRPGSTSTSSPAARRRRRCPRRRWGAC